MAQAFAEFIRKNASTGQDVPVSLAEIVARQVELENETKEVLGQKDVTKCTYSLGPLKQSVYACRTCAQNNMREGNSSSGKQEPPKSEKEYPIGVCFACSVSCHTDHDLVELFARRDFQCDCGTVRSKGTPCSLSPSKAETDRSARQENKYDHNFQNQFCFCGKHYDPDTEESDMFQCLVCEDWIHDACLGTHPHPDDWEYLVCALCINSRVKDTIGRWAGHPESGIMIVDQNDKVHGRIKARESSVEESGNQGNSEGATVDELKQEIELAKGKERTNEIKITEGEDSLVSALTSSRKRDSHYHPLSSSPSTETKRIKLEEKQNKNDNDEEQPNCHAPTSYNTLLNSIPAPFVYLEENFRSKLCKCKECFRSYADFSYLLEEESTYETPNDPSAESKSIMDPLLDADVLERLPRDKVIDGLEVWNKMQTRFQKFLADFARDNKVVQENDIKEFFANEKRRLNRY